MGLRIASALDAKFGLVWWVTIVRFLLSTSASKARWPSANILTRRSAAVASKKQKSQTLKRRSTRLNFFLLVVLLVVLFKNSLASYWFKRTVGGKGGIRTHGWGSLIASFQDWSIQPLCHLSEEELNYTQFRKTGKLLKIGRYPDGIFWGIFSVVWLK